MKRYRMIGSCRIKLDDERWIYPGQGVFSADMSPSEERWFVSIGSVQVIEPPKQHDSSPKEGGK